MSEPTRAALRQMTDPGSILREPTYEEVTDAEFDAIARAEGYVKDSFALQAARDTADKLALDWLTSKPLPPSLRTEALRALLTVPCPTCDGTGKNYEWELDGQPDDLCKNFDCIDGRVLAKGVASRLADILRSEVAMALDFNLADEAEDWVETLLLNLWLEADR